jgi:3-hexulose-6-phosphate synthase
MGTRLQLALDFVELEDALALLKKVHSFVDIVEVGTPSIIRYGVEAVRIVKQSYPQKPLLADLKIMDGGEGEARLAFEAGANIVTVMAVAHDKTILGAVRAAAKFGGQIMADLMSVLLPAQRAQEVEQLGCHIVCVHTATDAKPLSFPGKRESSRESSAQALECIRLLRTCVSRAEIAVAGGIDVERAKAACELGVDILVVGSAILKAKDQREAARALHQICARQGRK